MYATPKKDFSIPIVLQTGLRTGMNENLPAFQRRRRRTQDTRARSIGMGGVLLLHGILLLIYLFHNERPVVSPSPATPILVNIIAAEKALPEKRSRPVVKSLALPPVPPVPQVPMLDIPLLPPSNAAITLPAAPAPVTSPARQTAPQTQKDYYSKLKAYLDRYKRYPHAARLRREQGVVQVKFNLNRDGHILSYAVVKSSGFAALDEEAQSLMARAGRLPPFPDDMTEERLEVHLPIAFSMR